MVAIRAESGALCSLARLSRRDPLLPCSCAAPVFLLGFPHFGCSLLFLCTALLAVPFRSLRPTHQFNPRLLQRPPCSFFWGISIDQIFAPQRHRLSTNTTLFPPAPILLEIIPVWFFLSSRVHVNHSISSHLFFRPPGISTYLG